RKPSLELVRRAEIVQATGEDWSDVALAVSTVRTAKGGSAPELKPMVVRYIEPLAPPAPAAAAESRVVRQQLDKRAKDELSNRADVFRFGGGEFFGTVEKTKAPDLQAEEHNAVLETGGFQAVFRVPGCISVATNEGAKSFRIGSATIAPDLLVRAAPSL